MKIVAVIAVGLGLAAVTGCGTGSTGSTGTPPALQLTDAGGAAKGGAEPAIAGPGVASSYVLRAALPTSTPAPAPVWRFPRARRADADRVAAALGPATGVGSVTAVKGGWVARAAGNRLVVRTDGTWSWGLDCSTGVPIDQENLDVMCASASTSTDQPAGPTAAAARSLAAPVLDRLGWAGGDVRADAGRPTTTVTAGRSLGGTPTAGWMTTLTFTAPDVLTDAVGWATEPDRGRSYPLVDAASAFASFEKLPRALPEICLPRKDGKPGCAPIPPAVITGVTLGVSLHHDPDGPLLVPAWLFTIEGATQPLAVVAVEPRFVSPPPSVLPLPLPPGSQEPGGVNGATPQTAGPASASASAPPTTRG